MSVMIETRWGVMRVRRWADDVVAGAGSVWRDGIDVMGLIQLPDSAFHQHEELVFLGSRGR